MTYKISSYWNMFQYSLFPMLEEELGPLGPNHLKLAGILDLIRVERFIPYGGLGIQGRGRPCADRNALARAFVAKIVFKFTFTRQLIDRLLSDKPLRQICGWTWGSKIPSESKFSRAFAEFAESKLPDRIHESLIQQTFGGTVVGHAVIDSTPIEAREKAVKTSKKSSSSKKVKASTDTSTNPNKSPRKRGRNWTKEEKAAARSICEKQASGEFNLDEMLKMLPCECTIAMKKKPGLSNYLWKGYKLHLASDPHGIPLAATVTSATLNDHEAMIPLTEMLKKRCTHLYQLMDSAYDVKAVISYLNSEKIVPIVDKKPYTAKQKREKKEEQERRKVLNFRTAEEVRYKDRKLGERPNALMKDFFGAGNVFYRGAQKVSCHLMFGVVTLTAMLIMGSG